MPARLDAMSEDSDDESVPGFSEEGDLVDSFKRQDRGVQELLCRVAAFVKDLRDEATRQVEAENRQLRLMNMSLRAQRAQELASVRTAAFAGTGEMPPSPLAPHEAVPSLKLTTFKPAGEKPTAVAPATLHVPVPNGPAEPMPMSLPGETSAFSKEHYLRGAAMGSSTRMDLTTTLPDHQPSIMSKDNGFGRSKHTRRASITLPKRLSFSLQKEGGSEGPAEGVFADANVMKEKVRQAIARPEYNVANFYHDTGICQRIARSNWFEYLTLTVIFLNSIWIAVDTDFNTAKVITQAESHFQAVEYVFSAYFMGELLIRFGAFKQKSKVLKDTWFVFDFALVVLMSIETWVVAILVGAFDFDGTRGLGDAAVLRLMKLLRMTRMARMVRLLRAMPELMILVKGIMVAARSVFFTLCLLVIFIYVFAIAFKQLATGTRIGETYFSSVGKSMSTLLLRGTLPDMAELVEGVGQEHAGFAVLIMVFILLVSLTVMNMLVGVLVEVVSVVSAVEKEQLQVTFVKNKLLSMLENNGIDGDDNQHISRHEFEQILVKPEAAKIIQDVGVDVVGLVDFVDFIFKDDTELSFPRFMELMLELRGTNTATVKDVVDMRKWVAEEFKHLTEMLYRARVPNTSKGTKRQKTGKGGRPPHDGGGGGAGCTPVTRLTPPSPRRLEPSDQLGGMWCARSPMAAAATEWDASAQPQAAGASQQGGQQSGRWNGRRSLVAAGGRYEDVDVIDLFHQRSAAPSPEGRRE